MVRCRGAPDLIENARLAGGNVGKILNGAKPTGLPAQNSTKFHTFNPDNQEIIASDPGFGPRSAAALLPNRGPRLVDSLGRVAGTWREA